MKVVFIKKAVLVLAIFVIAFLSAYGLNSAGLEVSATFQNRKIPIYSVDTSENKIAISFDAAWGADKTREIMSICDSYGIKATFFLVGFWVEEYPDMVKEIYNNGFEIGLHSNTHPDMTKLSKKEIKQELETNISLIEELTGFRPKLFRPPYGYYNNDLIEVCESMGISCIEWSVDSLDWKGLSGGEIATRILNRIKPGSIILCHNNSDHILDALPIILDRLKLQGYTVGCIGDLVYKDNYIIDRAGVQKLAEQS